MRGELGSGGFATVYRAWDKDLGREVALKALHLHSAAQPEIRRRFVQEAKMLASVRHAHIVTVHDVGEADGRPFFAMELIDGRTLADALAAHPVMTLAQTLEVFQQLGDAVDELHRVNLVHRDLKPSNVLIDRGGRVVLMDLGIARSLSGGTQHTVAGSVMGTLEYMAPEQVRGVTVGRAADIYALGVIAYRCLSGKPPFEGDTGVLLYAHVHQPPRTSRTIAVESRRKGHLRAARSRIANRQARL